MNGLKMNAELIRSGLITSILVGWSFTVNADPHASVASQDENQWVAEQLCQSALVSSQALRAKARELNVSIKRVKQLQCNELGVLAFVEANQEQDLGFNVKNLANIE